MKRNGFFTWFVVATVLLASLACGLPAGFGGAGVPPSPTPLATAAGTAGTASAGAASPTAVAKTTSVTATVPAKTATSAPPTPTATPKGPNPIPLPLRQSMASLNSYSLKIRMVNNGPTKDDRNENNIVYEVDTKSDSSHTHRESISSSADDPKGDTSISDSYQVGLKTCEVDGSGSSTTGELSDNDPMVKDITTAMSYLLDFSLTSENPVFAGEETVNSVLANHFTFKSTRLGKESGMVVTKNSGDYWIAKDGQYLVKYVVILELSSDKAGTKVMHSETQVELSKINQAISISIPANCKKK